MKTFSTAVASFGSKANVLRKLSHVIKSARLLPQVSFGEHEWNSNREAVLRQIKDQLDSTCFAVRSSCTEEDTAYISNAGKYATVLNVALLDLEEAVNQVFASFGDAPEGSEVFVQPMLENVIRSGVAFSHDPISGSPYRVVSCFEGTDTTAVTSGRGGETWYHAVDSTTYADTRIISLIKLIDECLAVFGNIPIDIEFAVTASKGIEVVWLLQVRALQVGGVPEDLQEFRARIAQVGQQIARGMKSHPFLMGDRTVYGVMPDWNPAEILGLRPRPLALSLYRELVTDAIWAYQRNNYGYRNLRSFPLLVHFAGMPYVDVRLSFNSFVPSTLSDDVAARLVNYYVDSLVAEPYLHDKIEFEIVYSCYTLDLPQRLEKLRSAGFSIKDTELMSAALRDLTNRVIHPDKGLWHEDSRRLDLLDVRRDALFAGESDIVERIYWLLEDAKRYGSLPFAGLARAGFIAVQMLQSLVSVGTLSDDDSSAFMRSISTISKQMTLDLALHDKTIFFSKYGHLRPGTYDILSSRYDEAPDQYFGAKFDNELITEVEPFRLSLPQLSELSSKLNEHGLDMEPVALFTFMKSAIEQREMGKFKFTRNLSDALSMLGTLGESVGISREQMSFADIAVIKEIHVGGGRIKEILERSIAVGQMRYEEGQRIVLPSLITKSSDPWSFRVLDDEPNFITKKRVISDVSMLGAPNDLRGKIVCIPSADPGFDWLFATGITGLITEWGGSIAIWPYDPAN